MNDTSGSRKKGGRPKLQPDNLPLIVAESRSRVREEVVMPAHTARLLRRYVRWASKAASITEEEAMSLTIGLAIDELLKRDRSWGKAKAETEPRDDDGGTRNHKAGQPESGRPPALPPSGAGPRNGNPSGPAPREL